MRRIRNFVFLSALVATLFIFLGVNATFVPAAHAQAGTSTGVIQGTVLDPNGGIIAGAKVSITSNQTGAKVSAEVTSTGTYNSGPLVPLPGPQSQHASRQRTNVPRRLPDPLERHPRSLPKKVKR
jgi:hypothetical protein